MRLSRVQTDFIKRHEGFEYPMALLFGRDLRTMVSLARKGLVEEKKRGKKIVFAVTREGRHAAHSLGM